LTGFLYFLFANLETIIRESFTEIIATLFVKDKIRFIIITNI
jgi:hypothetical protein